MLTGIWGCAPCTATMMAPSIGNGFGSPPQASLVLFAATGARSIAAPQQVKQLQALARIEGFFLATTLCQNVIENEN